MPIYIVGSNVQVTAERLLLGKVTLTQDADVLKRQLIIQSKVKVFRSLDEAKLYAELTGTQAPLSTDICANRNNAPIFSVEAPEIQKTIDDALPTAWQSEVVKYASSCYLANAQDEVNNQHLSVPLEGIETPGYLLVNTRDIGAILTCQIFIFSRRNSPYDAAEIPAETLIFEHDYTVPTWTDKFNQLFN